MTKKDVVVGVLVVLACMFICFCLTCVKISTVVTKVPTRDMLIAKYSDVYGISTHLIKAIIQSESSGHPNRIRCDRKWLENEPWVIRTVGKYKLDWDNDITYSSMGLMQVLYLVAVSQGLDKDRPMDLLIPATNIKYGCMKLGELYRKYENTFDTISAYNWGSISTFWSVKDKCYKYKNHQYVVETIDTYRRLGGTE